MLESGVKGDQESAREKGSSSTETLMAVAGHSQENAGHSVVTKDIAGSGNQRDTYGIDKERRGKGVRRNRQEFHPTGDSNIIET